MPHVIVKMLPGRSEDLKAKLADKITSVITKLTGNTEDAISVSIEEVKQAEWTEKVYKPDIAGNWSKLYKKPGYDPFG